MQQYRTVNLSNLNKSFPKIITKSIDNINTPKKEDSFDQTNELFINFHPIKKLHFKNFNSSIIKIGYNNNLLNSTKIISGNDIIQKNSNNLKIQLFNSNQNRNRSLIFPNNLKSKYNYKILLQTINKYLKPENKAGIKNNFYYRKQIYNILKKRNIKQLTIRKHLKLKSYNPKYNSKKDTTFNKDFISKTMMKKNHKCNFFNKSNDNLDEIKIINKETREKENLSLSDTYNSFNKETKNIENTVFGEKILSETLLHKNIINKDSDVKKNANRIFLQKITDNIYLRNKNNCLFQKNTGKNRNRNSNSMDYIYNCNNKRKQKINKNSDKIGKLNKAKNFPIISKNAIFNSYLREKIFNEQ